MTKVSNPTSLGLASGRLLGAVLGMALTVVLVGIPSAAAHSFTDQLGDGSNSRVDIAAATVHVEPRRVTLELTMATTLDPLAVSYTCETFPASAEARPRHVYVARWVSGNVTAKHAHDHAGWGNGSWAYEQDNLTWTDVPLVHSSAAGTTLQAVLGRVESLGTNTWRLQCEADDAEGGDKTVLGRLPIHDVAKAPAPSGVFLLVVCGAALLVFRSVGGRR